MRLYSPVIVLLVLAAAAVTGCSKKSARPAEGGPPEPVKLIVQLDWVAEPEHGAFYTAEALGYFREEGLDVTLLQGGPNTYVQAKVATNQAQLGQDDSTNAIL